MAANSMEEKLYTSNDWSSFSNPTEAVSTSIRLEWNLDFDQQSIRGAAEHIVRVLRSSTQQVCFDSSNINIIGDVLLNNEVATYVCSDKHSTLGTKISVSIPEALQFEGASFSILFKYSIDNTATAVQWLPASATKGGKFPYLFTQSQAIHARSLLPCMDSPGVKTAYNATVSVPKWCTVLMSALSDNSKQSTVSDERNVFHWTQPVPIPAYLIALAAGNLVSRDISDRVRIWSEPEVVEAAQFEFSETEDFLAAAEAITNCPYQWRRYDVLCLPPSFPYGGMENPCLTFATPTLLAGDRSLADVIAHEIAHSWTGNLVTNLTWDHFWLNEGWTVWLERKITSKVKCDDEVGKLSAQIGYKHLQDDIHRMGKDDVFTCMLWPLTGQDPDDAFSSVPYEKVS
jgi:leukotriene-A4 hydrolase